MQKFKEMIEQVKRQKSIPVAGVGLNPPWGAAKEFPPEFFFKFVEQCQPFVFFPTNKEPIDLELDDASEEENDPKSFSAPFKVWSAEIFGDDHYITIPKADDPIGVYVISFMAVESSDTHSMFYFMYVKVTNGLSSYKKVAITDTLDGVAKSMLERMNSSKEVFGNENARHRIRLGSGKDKRIVTIRNIIYVKPKKQKTLIDVGNAPRVIEWKQRWWVRGSWHYFWLDKDSRIADESRIGKCREGCYCQTGRTWHREHQKGGSELLSMNKVRIVKSETDS